MRHEVKERFSLPTWKAFKIEQEVFDKFSKYRIQYSPGIEAAPLVSVFWIVVIRYKIIKVGISNNPRNRVNSINRDARSGYTEYLEVPPIVYVRIVAFIFRKWFLWTVFYPAFLLAFIVLLVIIFVVL